MNYHVARNGQQLGIYPKDDAIARLQRGEILATDLVWTEGMTNWLPASSVFGAVAPVVGVTLPAPPMPAATTSASLGDRPPKPDNYLVWSILVTLLCCIVGGVIAIIYSTQVDSKYNAGDYAGAAAAAKSAKTWVIVSVVVGLLFSVAYVGFTVLNIASSVHGMR